MDKPEIKHTATHDAAFSALWALRTPDFEQARRNNPNGLHRLIHLVPELAPDQPSLARLLAEAALHHRADSWGDDYWLARRAFQKNSPAALAKAAATSIGTSDDKGVKQKRRAIAWRACELYLDPQNRLRIEHTKGGPEKVLSPVPEPIEELMERHFCGLVVRPELTDDDGMKDAVRFAVWCALEAGVTATSRSPNTATACAIVAETLNSSYKEVVRLWESRAIHRTRTRT